MAREDERRPVSSRLASIGIPVYQGEDFLSETLDSVLAQDYENLEIVISDNASTDATVAIVEAKCRGLSKVRLIRQTANVGAAENYNVVFREALGEYFAWNAHDDISSPDFVSSAVAALEEEPTAAVAYGLPFWVDAEGEKLRPIPVPPGVADPSPAKRFRSAARGHPAALVFGMYRSHFVGRGHLHEAFTGSDRNFVAEMMLYGPAVAAGDAEFYLREHENRSVRRLNRADGKRMAHRREGWYSPSRARRIVFPSWRRLRGYARAIISAPLTQRQRVSCFGVLVLLLFDDRLRLLRQLFRDLLIAAATLFGRMRSRGGNP